MGESEEAALRTLDTDQFRAIIVTDEGLTKKPNKAFLDKLISYVQTGGVVLVELHFTRFTQMDAFDAFWASWGLGWKSGDYQRADFEFVQDCTLPGGMEKKNLDVEYSMKVLHVANAKKGEKIFVEKRENDDGSFDLGDVEKVQAAVVGTKVGNGWLSYVGDVNGEKGSDEVIVALCGLQSGIPQLQKWK